MSEIESKEDVKETVSAEAEQVEASKEAIKAVEAMKAAQAQSEEPETVYITAGMEWCKAMKDLEEEVEKELSKANTIINDVIAKERAKVRETLQKEFAEKEKELIEQQEQKTEQLNKEHEAELEKMKKLYAEQLDEASAAFRDKLAALRKEIDQHKEQIEVLMLHIDDPFVLQEMQMKQAQAEKDAEQAEELTEEK